MQQTVPKSDIPPAPQPVEQEVLQAAEDLPPAPAREITQTDRINKNLLSSFLGRINNDSQFSRFLEDESSNPNSNSSGFDDED